TVGCQGWQPRATRMYLLRVRCRRYPNAQTPKPTRSTLPDSGSGWFRRSHKPIRLDDQHIAGHFIQQAFGSMANQGAVQSRTGDGAHDQQIDILLGDELWNSLFRITLQQMLLIIRHAGLNRERAQCLLVMLLHLGG